MNWLAPTWHAWFLLLAAVPLILYLLFRRRRRDVAWAAIYVLRRLLQSKSHLNAWRQYVILALRALALALLALAFLWPHRRWRASDANSFPPAPSSTHRLILLDTSASMDAAWRNGTSFDAALSFVRKALDAARPPGRVDLLPLDGRSEPISFEHLPVSQQDIEHALARLPRSDNPADFETSVRTALRLLRASQHQHKEVIVLSDFSARDLRDRHASREAFAALNRLGARVFSLNFANDQAHNVALLDLQAGMDLILAGQPTLFYLTLGYFGASATSETTISIRDDRGEVLDERSVPLAPGEQTLEIPLTLAEGRRVLVAQSADDDYPADNTVTRSFEVRDTLRVLVVQDIDLRTGLENPRRWLELALGQQTTGEDGQPSAHLLPVRQRAGQPAPRENGQPNRYHTALDFVYAAQLGPALLVEQEYDGVILLDIDTLAPEAVEALRLYAVRGGTLLLAPGPKVDPQRFKQHLRALAPARLIEPAFAKIDPDVSEHPLLEQAEDRLMRELESPEHGQIGTAQIYNYYRLEPTTETQDVECLLGLSNGAPLLLGRRLGRGNALLWTAGLGMDWHALVVHPGYPVFFSRLFNRAAAQHRFALNLEAGQPIIQEVTTDEAILVRPDDQRVTLASLALGRRRLVRYDQTDRPGAYRLYADVNEPENALTFHVRGRHDESDYRPLTQDQVKELEAGWAMRLCANERDLLTEMSAAYPGRPLTPLVAATMFVLLVSEAGLARRWFA